MPPITNHDKNKLYYGDNLEVLRDYIPDQSVDLIYLDPPPVRTTTSSSPRKTAAVPHRRSLPSKI
jgi:hypothetical protein